METNRENDPDERARRRAWREFGIPAAAFLVAAGALTVVLLARHRPDPVDLPIVVTWPPVPDSGAIAIAAPVSAPLELATGEMESPLVARYSGTMTLDAEGLHFGTADGARGSLPDFDRPLLVDSIVFAIAEAAPTGWRIAWRSAAFVPPDSAALPPALTIPDVRPVDLVDRWPAIVQFFRTEFHPGVMTSTGHALQGRRDAFMPLLSALVANQRSSRPSYDTAAVAAVRLPTTVSGLRMEDADSLDGVTAWYDHTILRLGPDGLLLTGPGGSMQGYVVTRLLLDSTFVGRAAVEATTLALAEATPYGWRIVKSAEAMRRRGGFNSNFSFAGNPLVTPVTDSMTLPGVLPADLPGRWLVVINDLVIQDSTYQRTHIQVISRGDPWTFDGLLAPKPWAPAPAR